MSARGSAIVLRCSLTEQCDFHRDGGPEVEKCPGVCDADGCNRDGTVEVAGERTLCEPHAALTVLARALREALAADDARGETSAPKAEPKASTFLSAPQQLPRWRPDDAKGGR
jgi:hypothetical protein